MPLSSQWVSLFLAGEFIALFQNIDVVTLARSTWYILGLVHHSQA